MILNFKQYLLQENASTGYIVFGDFQIPTTIHGQLFDEVASKGDYRIFTENSSESLLEYKTKIKLMRKMFPRHARKIVFNGSIQSIKDAVNESLSLGHSNVTAYVCESSVSKHKMELADLPVKLIACNISDVISEQLHHARSGDFAHFSQNVPNSFSNENTKDLFNDIRKGLDLKETTTFSRHIKLKPVSEERERFVKGDLFSVGDVVRINETNQEATVIRLGANFVVLEDCTGKKTNKWLTDVSLLESPEVVESPQISGFRKIMDKRLDDRLKKAAKEINSIIQPKDSDYKRISKKYNIKDHKTLQGYMATKGWK